MLPLKRTGQTKDNETSRRSSNAETFGPVHAHLLGKQMTNIQTNVSESLAWRVMP